MFCRREPADTHYCQAAIPIKFRVRDPSPDLALGRPLTVEVETRETVRGVILPAASIVRAPNGESIVFEHVRAETFTPRSVSDCG